jgi:hypothetical protein
MIEQASSLSDKQKDWFSIASILCIVLIRFYKTVFAGQSISKEFLAAHWDSLFYVLRAGQSLSMDCSFCGLCIPYRFFVAEYWHHGLPIWNQLNGFGMPILADPQFFSFSPLYALFTVFPGLQTCNLLLIAQLAIAGISTYLLCRELQFNFIVGLIAALLFIFCPFLQWQIELMGPGFCLTPFVFLMFSRMANKGSFWNIVFAGIAAAVDILSSHPEMVFVTVFFAVIWTGFCCYSRDPYAMLSWLRVASFRVALAGLIAFGLCAPMLIPFIEYAANAESYKLHTIAAAGLPWQAILANYLFPFQSQASIFFGPLSLWGLIASFIYFDKLNRFAKPLIICFFISLIGIIRPLPFNFLFYVPPLSMTFATYWLPEYLLFTCILSGVGCSYLIEKLFNDSLFRDKKRLLALIAIGIMLLVIPLSYTPWHSNNASMILDQTFALPHFNWKVWISNTSFAMVPLILFLTGIKKSINWKIFVSLVSLALGFTAILLISVKALPIRPLFKYPTTLPFTANERTDRILSIGNHLFTPNTNLIYRLPSLKVLSPIYPKGFLGFVQACGAQTDQYSQIFSPVISSLLRLAGVNKIISEQPILDESVLTRQILNNSKKPNYSNAVVDFEKLISLSNIQLLYDPKASTIFFRAKAILHSLEDYRLCFSVENIYGNPITYTEPLVITAKSSKKDIFCSALIPRTASHWSISIRIMRDKTANFLAPSKIAFGKIRADKSWLIASDDQTSRFIKINNDRFELISKHGSILEYRDKTALNRYFFVNSITWVPNLSAALKYLQANPDQVNNIAVLEKQDREQFNASIKTIQKEENNSTSIDLTSFAQGTIKCLGDYNKLPFATASEFSLATETKSPSFLVASDIYYPGWNAYIDGIQTNIFRTDYLFRGIMIPAGKHTIKFIYQPLSLTMGLWLFFITIEITLFLGLKHHYFSQGRALTFKDRVAVKV